MQHRSERRDGMRIDWSMPITMDDRRVLRADVFRPIPDRKYPIILSHGPYSKGLAFQDGYTNQWQLMTAQDADVAAGSCNKYQKTIVIGSGRLCGWSHRTRTSADRSGTNLTGLNEGQGSGVEGED